jgi:hypothetical protein
MQHLLDETNEIPGPTVRQRAVMIGLALVVTTGLGALAYSLGSVAYEYRLREMHRARLARHVPDKPPLALLDEAFRKEGTLLLAAPTSDVDKDTAIRRYGRGAEAELTPKARQWPEMRVYQAGKEMTYFVFFDGDGLFSDFTCVRQR